MDGDGIETIGIGGTVVKFDHDANGVKTGTGWVKPDDGFLVWDRSGNGKIDSGRELFGVDTIKSNGQKATDGLDALANLDSNHDGVFDAADAHFADVRVWRDLNQDGVSQTNELSTLAQQGIVSIDLEVKLKTVNLGNGNTQTETTLFTRADGSEGAAGNVVEGDAANLDLAHNPFYREFEDAIELSPEVAQLPNMQGSGALRDLREAAQGSSELASQLQSLADAGLISREAYKARIAHIIDAWVETAAFQGSKALAAEPATGLPMALRYLPPGATANDISRLYLSFRESAGPTSNSGQEVAVMSDEERLRMEKMHADLVRIEKLINILEPVNGVTFVDISPDPEKPGVVTGTREYVAAKETPPPPPSSVGELVVSRAVYVSISQAQMDLLEQSYDALMDSVCDALLLQTRFKPWLDAITLEIDETGLHFNTSGLEAQLAQHWANAPEEALRDLVDLNRLGGDLLAGMGWSAIPLLRVWSETAQNNPALQESLQELGIQMGLGTLHGTAKADILLGDGQ